MFLKLLIFLHQFYICNRASRTRSIWVRIRNAYQGAWELVKMRLCSKSNSLFKLYSMLNMSYSSLTISPETLVMKDFTCCSSHDLKYSAFWSIQNWILSSSKSIVEILSLSLTIQMVKKFTTYLVTFRAVHSVVIRGCFKLCDCPWLALVYKNL